MHFFKKKWGYGKGAELVSNQRNNVHLKTTLFYDFAAQFSPFLFAHVLCVCNVNIHGITDILV